MKRDRIFLALLSIMICCSCSQAQNEETESLALVQTIQQENGSWRLVVDKEPYIIRGVVFTPVLVGEDPGNGTMRDWMRVDDDHNGENDFAYQTWLDANRNDRKDKNELARGDFQYLKDMGVNTIRVYHMPSDNSLLGNIYKENASTAQQYDHAVNKELLRDLTRTYGIRVIVGNFLGSWTIGSGASWEEGTDYTNPVHRDNIKKSVKAMVLDSKDEPYVLLWALGNENNIADASKCNAKTQPDAYASLIGELVDMIHDLDPLHPVAVVDGDDNGRMLAYYRRHAPNLDMMAYNTYRRGKALNGIFRIVKRSFDRPVFLSETGQFAYDSRVGEDEALQEAFIKNSWDVVWRNTAFTFDPQDKSVYGNAVGVTYFDWVDRWYMDKKPSVHNPGIRPWASPDGIDHEEWFGLMSMGDGTKPLIRQKRKAYDYLKSVWTKGMALTK